MVIQGTRLELAVLAAAMLAFAPGCGSDAGIDVGSSDASPIPVDAAEDGAIADASSDRQADGPGPSDSSIDGPPDAGGNASPDAADDADASAPDASSDAAGDAPSDAPHDAPPICTTNDVSACGPIAQPFCRTVQCANAACVFTNTPSGTALPSSDQTAGDCRAIVCDGAGSVRSDPANDPPPPSNECVTSGCSGGSPTSTQKPTGTTCSLGVCAQGVCYASLCVDHVRDGNETGVDCGGGTCPACTVGDPCSAPRDCQSQSCRAGVCVAPTCTDGVRNGTESGTDCGGSCPDKCSNGDGCGAPSDCASGTCTGGVCVGAVCMTLGLPGPSIMPYPMPTPASLKIADFNRDGNPDLVFGDASRVLFGNGDGSFTPGAPLLGTPYRVAIADLNGDTNLDIYGVTTLGASVYINNGSGSFTRRALSSSIMGQDVDAADFDRDGAVDIVRANNNVYVDFNDGTGAFPTTVTRPFSDVQQVRAADLDGDGLPDLVLASYSDKKVRIMMNTGGRTFGPDIAYSIPNSPSAIAVADIDGDGDKDVVVTTSENVTQTSIFMAFFNQGNGTLSGGATYGIGRLANSTELLVTDVDADGKLDVVTAGKAPGTINVLRGIGGGAFAPTYEVLADQPVAIAAGDLDGDGHVDFVTGSANGVSTVLQRQGSFVVRSDLHVGFDYDRIASGSPLATVIASDLDGDGHPDLVTAEAGDALELRMNRGGGFAAPVYVPTAGGGLSVVARDVNADGATDLVVGTTRGAVSVLRNAGGGSFAPHVDYEIGGGPTAVATGDFDGDGRIDIVAADCATSRFAILRNAGSGTFAAPTFVLTGKCPRYVAAGDANGDGLADVAVAEFQTGTVLVFLNQGGATFGSPASYALVTPEPYGIAMGDLDGDSRQDIAVANYLNGTVGVLLNTGGGSFAAPVNYASTYNPTSLTLADVNADGRLDVLTANNFSASQWTGDFGVLLNAGNGTFAAPLFVPPLGAAGASVTAADFDGDGFVDLATADADGTALRFGAGTGNFPAPTFFHDVSGALQGVATGDIDGDGHVDVVAGGTNTLEVLYNKGGATFAPAFSIYTGWQSRQVAVGDLDGNGMLDILTTIQPSSSGQAYGGVIVALNQGGSFSLANVAVGSMAEGLAIGDLDGDGQPDVVAVETYRSYVRVFANHGGTLTRAADYPIDGYASMVAIGDLSGDGLPDLAVSVRVSPGIAPDSVVILVNRGAFSFVAGPVITLPGTPGDVRVVDMNGDRQLDITVTLLSDAVGLLLSAGNGTFQPLASYPSPSNGTSRLAVGDFNGDGRPDLATPGYSIKAVRVFLNTGGALAPFLEYPTGAAPYNIDSADLDGDGRPDLAVLNRDDQSVSVLRSRCW